MANNSGFVQYMLLHRHVNIMLLRLFLAFFLYWPRPYLSITPGSVSFEILITKIFGRIFVKIRSALNSSVDSVLATEGDRLFQCGIVQVGRGGIIQSITVCLVSAVLGTL